MIIYCVHRFTYIFHNHQINKYLIHYLLLFGTIHASAPGEDPCINDNKGNDKGHKKQNDKKQKKKQTKQNNANKKVPTSAVDPNLPDICKLEFKVGCITKVWVHPDADKLYCEEIDCGEEGGPRQIASGLRMHYSVEEMLGKRVLVVANLKVRVVSQ